MRTRLPLTALAAATLVLVTACSAPSGPGTTPSSASAPASADASTPAQDDAVLAGLGLAGLTGAEIVERLDASPDARPLAMTASVREDAVLVGDGTTEVAVPLEDGTFYVSIAPYVTGTHECYYHSLATCQGELAGEDVEVTITAADGTVLVDEAATTYANGFVGFWLPEDVEGTIEVRQGALVGSVPFSTTPGSPTCVTTLKMA